MNSEHSGDEAGSSGIGTAKLPRLQLDPRLGDAVLQLIERQTGRACHLAMIVCPMDGMKLGQPAFVTSLEAADMESLIVQVAGGFALAGKPTVSGRA